MSVWDKRKNFCMVVDQPLLLVEPTPLQSAKPMALSAMAVEYELIIMMVN